MRPWPCKLSFAILDHHTYAWSTMFVAWCNNSQRLSYVDAVTTGQLQHPGSNSSYKPSLRMIILDQVLAWADRLQPCRPDARVALRSVYLGLLVLKAVSRSHFDKCDLVSRSL